MANKIANFFFYSIIAGILALFCYMIFLESHSHNEDKRLDNITHVVFHTAYKYTFFVKTGPESEKPITLYFEDYSSPPEIIRDLDYETSPFCYVDYKESFQHNGNSITLTGTTHLHRDPDDQQLFAGEHSYRVNKRWHSEQPVFLE